MDNNGHDVTPDWLFAKQGISLMLNNQMERAEQMFKERPNSIQVSAAYSFLTFMSALMSFEDDKLTTALTTLREMEKRCESDVGWLRSFRNRFSTAETSKPLAETLEEQIILADSQMCIALLTFLHQDLSGYMKGGWVLRKAWKVYQNTYTQVLGIYKKTFSDQPIMPITPVNTWIPMTPSPSDYTIQSSASSPTEPVASPSSKPRKSSFNIKTTLGNTMKLNRDNLTLELNGVSSTSGNGYSSPLYLFTPLRFFGTTPDSMSAFYDTSLALKHDLEPATVSRLMSAVSFGYGVFQLSISLLPPNLLRLIHFLGFEGDRRAGITSLMYARQGDDMRAPLATLALLWYHTIVRPFFAVDGSNTHSEIESASALITESEQEFAESALFLFFKGRVDRLQSNISAAIVSYQAAVDVSTQWEIQLLCLHEIGWCHLIQCNFLPAHNSFTTLKNRSRWSKSFYAYMSAICQGAAGIFDNIVAAKSEINEYLNKSMLKEAQVEKYISRRVSKFPNDPNSKCLGNIVYWKLYTYEMLFLWNALTSCDPDTLRAIIADSTISVPEPSYEPMQGLAQLIVGACHCILHEWALAIAAYRTVLEQRNVAHHSQGLEDAHISVFARYELAILLVRVSETREEGKLLLTEAQQYKEYDFENRLSVRIHSALKKIEKMH